VRWIFFVLLAANVALLVVHTVEVRRQQRLEALNSAPGGDGRISGAPLVLVSELTDQQRRDMAKAKGAGKPISPPPIVAAVSKPVVVATTEDTAPAPQPAKPAISGSNQCISLGPVPTAAQAEQISQRLLAIRIITDIIDLDVPGNPEYWVILPPYADERQALQKLHELQGRVIAAQIIPKGEFANAISFGLHGQQEDADKQAEELNSRGYKVEVKAVPVMHKEKWLALSERQSPKLSDDIWQGLHKDFSWLGKQVKSCH